MCNKALWLQPCSKGLALSKYIAFACLFLPSNLMMTSLLIHGAASVTGTMTPAWIMSSSCCLNVAYCWTGTGLAGKHLGGTLGSTLMWYGSPGHWPSPSSISGKYFTISSLDVTSCFMRTLVVWLISTVLDISVVSSSISSSPSFGVVSSRLSTSSQHNKTLPSWFVTLKMSFCVCLPGYFTYTRVLPKVLDCVVCVLCHSALDRSQMLEVFVPS